MNSNRRTHASKPIKGETRLPVIEKNIPASVSARKPDVSVQHVKSPAAKMMNLYPEEGVFFVSSAVGVTSVRRNALVGKLQGKEYRDAYLRASITHGLAHQIRINRELRNLSQTSLAEKCGKTTTQVAISRLEDPAYGKFTLNTILKVASALDVAVLVRLVPYSKFLLETADKSVLGLFSKSFSEENLYAKQALVTLTMAENKPQTSSYVSINPTPKSIGLRIAAKKQELPDSRCGYAIFKSN